MRNSSQITHLHVKSPDSLRKQTYQVRAGGFPGGSDSKESACNAGDLGLILGSGRSPGEGCSCPLQYPCLGKPMGREGWRSQSKRSWRVRHDRVTNTHTHTHTHMDGWRASHYSGNASSKEPACQCRRHKKMWAPSLRREDPLEGGMVTQCSILAWRSLVGYSPWGHKELDMTEAT